MTLKGKAKHFFHSNCCDKFNSVCHLATDVREISLALKLSYICSAQSENRYNSGIVLRKVGILILSGEVGILTLRRAIPELLVRKVGIGTK